MKVLIIANGCGNWNSWSAKKEAIRAFYAPLVDLEIDIIPGYYTKIPYTGGPGTITTFGPNGATDMPGTEIKIDDNWIFHAVVSIALPYDICVFQTTGIFKPGMPLGLFVGSRSGVRICETFVNNENDNYYAPIDGHMIDYGNLAETIIKHEISHALYDIAGEYDRTHEFFYSNRFSNVLTDIDLRKYKTIISLYSQAISLLQKWLGILKTPMPTTKNPDVLLDWNTIEGAHHNVRALCDLCGLTWEQKQVLTACVKIESGFDISAINYNYAHRADGTKYIASIDSGIAQWNNVYHGSEITQDEALHYPEKAIRLMCQYWKAGQMNQWVSFSSGAYKQWLGKV